MNSQENLEGNYIKNLRSLQKIIFELTDDNIEESAKSTCNYFDAIHPYSFRLAICRLVYTAIISQNKDYNIFIKYLLAMESIEGEAVHYDQKITKIFLQLINKIDSQEVKFILEKMYENQLIDETFLKSKQSLLFSHHMKYDEILQLKRVPFSKQFLANIEELSKDNWALHKIYVNEGTNSTKIAQIIKNDDFKKLREISSQMNFNLNQNIEPSLYERHSFVNQFNISLIDYAAFFGSIKCFQFLLENGATVTNTGKFAVAGQNHEIIQLCSKNAATFEEAYETAIMFHRNEIFFYLSEFQISKMKDINELGKLCVEYDNYDILFFLENEGLNINEMMVQESAKNGNIYILMKYALKNSNLPKNILLNSVLSGNIEVIEYTFKFRDIDYNAKNV